MTTVHELIRGPVTGLELRQFPDEPFRPIASIAFDGTGQGRYKHNLFYKIAFVGGGQITVSSHEEVTVRPAKESA